ncbi:hypothetical protein KAFR_0K00370 [Kazachstania africana CBS 2517]|uniref:Oxidation resistance protein 1 n=1 Tax=Kazachstania africana (strain ATCC 22294 / BCRC 22015 / CBS 2517 / CECT 1963 / NBRC 1671 / NRRL Y-8276) TaxID=1071382 RepID=H2B192_KAZAF|nr:hypothetical protein KAFR_0K00370 [Kazachstania africana CBS 2517]CCF60392.1 hypothetical protein KAFR_0K00370 [Kazachstania africana CBS 2517]
MFGMKDAIYKLRRSFSLPEPPATKLDPNTKNFDDFDDFLPSVNLTGYSANTKNRLLTTDMCDEIRTLMPMRVQLYNEWTLLYSLEQHGASLHSLYDNIKPKDDDLTRRIGYVIVIKDAKNGIFGAYCNEPWEPNEHVRYYGNGECFLWKMNKVPNLNLDDKNDPDNKQLTQWQFQGFPYTGVNEFAIYCTSRFLSMGAGDGHYGLWCDDGLLHGVTYPCSTYGNETLSQEGNKFHIIGLEVWRVG